VGDLVGSYRVLEKIAEGGMGLIFRAEHHQLGREVVLKVLKPDLSQRTTLVRRFFQEARAVNRIGHPNIIDIIDFVEEGDHDPPRVFMVMESLKGEDLHVRIRKIGPLPPLEVVRIADQVADALIACHDLKILHRDLKPENIFLTHTAGGRPIIKLLDFGVAKALDAPRKMNLTDPGTAVGTPEYMSPEQFMNQEMDQRSDIYSLGLVLYYMLAGHAPFTSDKYGELLIMQVKHAPPPLTLHPRGRPPLPPALEQVVMRCLEKEPEERWQSMEEFRDAITSVLGAAPPQTEDSPLEASAADPYTSETAEIAAVIGHGPRLRQLAIMGSLIVLVLAVAAFLLWKKTADPPTSDVDVIAGKSIIPPLNGRPDKPPQRGTVAASQKTDAGPGLVAPPPLAAKGLKSALKSADTEGRAQVKHSRTPRKMLPKRAHQSPQAKKKARQGSQKRSTMETTVDPFAQ